MSWQIFQYWFNLPPDGITAYFTDKKGQKFWFEWVETYSPEIQIVKEREQAMEKEKIDLTGDLPTYYFRNIIPILRWPTPLHLLNPVMREKTDDKKNAIPSLKELGIIVGLDFESGFNKAAFEKHQKQFDTYRNFNSLAGIILYFLIAIFTMMAVILALVVLGIKPPAPDETNPLLNVIMTCVVLVIAYIAINTANRLTSIWIDRYYADTLSFVTCLYLLMHLRKENLLAFTKDRQQLLIRMRALKKYLILLPYQFSILDTPPENLARLRFKRMAEFVEKKENQIIAPLANTQAEVIAEIQTFLNILLTGNYGEFTFEDSADVSSASPTISMPSRILSGVLKFLGTLTPLFLLIGMFSYPDQLRILGLDNNMIGLISLAWLLLAIDANLKLGIVDRVSMLAKTFKDLK